MWFAILNFLNYIGMITNALILGLTSKYGTKYETTNFNYQIPSNVTAFDHTSNSTLTSFSMTVVSANNIWIILIFEVSIFFIHNFTQLTQHGVCTKEHIKKKLKMEDMLFLFFISAPQGII